MAKIKGTKFLQRVGLKRIASEVNVSTQPGGRIGESFYACVRIGGLRYAQRRGRRDVVRAAASTCAYGRTPKKAIAKALNKAAKAVSGRRHGVFAGTEKR